MTRSEYDQIQILPFLKWAGGKRWFVERHPHLFPQSFRRYVEPFLGGGATFFKLQPQSAILSDVNAELINTYVSIRNRWRLVRRYLNAHKINHCADYYYLERKRKRISPESRAAQFLYLNRTCWNGLYRVNLKGEFNVPIGTKTSIHLSSDNFEATSRLLMKADICSDDFEQTISRCRPTDFLFVDPPYTVKHNLNGFVKYNESIFTWSDQERLREAIEAVALRGSKILVTNANHESVRALYRDIGTHFVIPRKSVLAGNAASRGLTDELIIVINYAPRATP